MSEQLTVEQINSFMGVNATNIDEFKTEVNKNFYSAEQIFKDPETKSKVFGKVLGSVTNEIKKIFDEAGVEITGDDLKQPIEAVVKTGLSRISEKFDLDKQELQKVAGLTVDEKIKEFQSTITQKDQKIKDYEKLLKEKASEFETLTASKNQELKNFKLGLVKKDAEGAIQWDPARDEFSKKGFLATLNEKYVIDLDENGESYILDKATNARVKAEGSHSTFMSPADVFKMEAIKANMALVNKKAGQPAPRGAVSPPPATPPPPAPQPYGKKTMAATRYQQ